MDAGCHVHGKHARGGDLRNFQAIIMMSLACAAGCAGPISAKTSSHAYGGDRRQIIDLFVPDGARGAPLVLFVHGGGWSAGSRHDNGGGQAKHFTDKGYAWATMGYRLVPAVAVEDQAADIARALAWLHRRGGRLGLDMRRIILIGHSSGAQLVGLVGTDPQWLGKAGVDFAAIRGVISLDGAGIDVPGIMAAGASSSPFYAGAFGPDAARQARLSPLAHVGGKDAPRWLLLYDREHNQAAGFFAERFAKAARAKRLRSAAVGIGGTSHMGMLRTLGTPGDATTRAIDEFIADALEPPADQ